MSIVIGEKLYPSVLYHVIIVYLKSCLKSSCRLVFLWSIVEDLVDISLDDVSSILRVCDEYMRDFSITNNCNEVRC